MTIDEIRRLDALIREVTGTHPDLPDPWRIVVPPTSGGQVVKVQVDPIEAERRGHGPRSDEIMRFGRGVTFGQACEAVIGKLAEEAGKERA